MLNNPSPDFPVKKAPCTFFQHGLWYQQILHPESTAYNLGYALDITGELDVSLLNQALHQIILRHPSLRTCFEPGPDGRPIQVILPDCELELPLVDLENSSKNEINLEVLKRRVEIVQKPFDLSQAPLLRVCLLRRSVTENTLLIAVHHVIFDAWSRNIFIQDLLLIYNTIKNGGVLNQPPSVDITDFALWQQNHLQGDVLADLQSFWKEQLAGAPTFLDIPSTSPRPAQMEQHGERVELEISPELCANLRALAREEKATLFMTLLTGLAVVLHHYTRQEEIIIGIPVTQRHQQEWEAVIGYFINILPVRINLAGEPTFVELLRRVRRTCFEVYEHSTLPFEKLVEALSISRDPSREPVFQMMLASQTYPFHYQDNSGLSVDTHELETGAAQFDFSFNLVEEPNRVHGSINFQTALFSPAAMRRLAGHFNTFLNSAAAQPDQPIQNLAYLTDAEKQQILVDWNKTETDDPYQTTITEMFAAQVTRTPQAAALKFESQTLTYLELDQRSNRLARFLQKKGVQPEKRVGVSLTRSFDLLTAILAVMKAGGVYVPLNPEQPAQRLADMARQAQVELLVTREEFNQALVGMNLEMVSLDVQEDEINLESDADLPPCAKPDNLAYILFTSGSSGSPKGVMIEHQAICSRLFWYQKDFPLTNTDVALQNAPVDFDVSIREIFWCLTVGACLVINRPGGERDIEQLTELIAREKISVVGFIPSFLNALLSQTDLSGLASLRLVICGGEKLPPAVANLFFSRLNARLTNRYGPTECSVIATEWWCSPGESSPSLPIGFPIDNTKLYILDPYRQPVPVGIPGEIYLGGVGLARGYASQPELTAEAFVHHPQFGRLYRTGDRARWREDGAVEFLGRIDQQMKIRGVRIEPGEVENVLALHPAVENAVAAIHNVTAEDTRLAAYLVLKPGAHVTSRELHEFARQRLSETMLPGEFYQLEEFPLKINGKIDLQALTEPGRAALIEDDDFQPAQGELETKLEKIWIEVLGVEKIDRRANFFDLGGHSLNAVHLLLQVEKLLGVHLTVASFFTAPSLASQAELLRVKDEAKYPPSVVPLQPLGQQTPLFMPGFSISYRELASYFVGKRPVFGLQFAPVIASDKNNKTLEEMAASMIDAMQQVQPKGPYLLAGWSFGGYVAFEMARQLHASGEKVALLVMLDTRANLLPHFYSLQPIHHALRNWTGSLLAKTGFHLRQMTGKPVNTWPAYLLERLKPEIDRNDINDELFTDTKAETPTLNYQAISSKYHPARYPGSMLVLRARQSHPANFDTRYLGWEELVTGDLNMNWIPGDHVSIIQPPNVPELAQKLSQAFDHLNL